MKSHNRWIEIRFAYLCYALYDNLRDYMLTTSYLEFLADIAKVERAQALRLLQKVYQLNNIRPSTTEFICIARQNKQTIDSIVKILKISKSTYIEYSHQIDLSIDYPQHCSLSEIAIMEKIIEAHKKLKEAGL